MKTIIVLTDFSKIARNAANAAVEIAIQCNSNILLVNSYLLPFSIFATEAEGRSLVDTALIASVSESGLKKEVRRLNRMLNLKAGSISKPKIDFLSSIEPINQTLKTLNESVNILMMVMGVHQTSLPLLFSAIDLEPLLDQLMYPLLIMPKNHKGFPIKKFVFATDLENESLPAIEQIQYYAKTFKFHIHVCHVSKPVFIPNFTAEDKLLKFENTIAKLEQSNISFTDLKGKNVAKTLNEFNISIGADMLGIVYNPHSFGWKLMHGSHSAKLIRNQKLPLFIFPANAE